MAGASGVRVRALARPLFMRIQKTMCLLSDLGIDLASETITMSGKKLIAIIEIIRLPWFCVDPELPTQLGFTVPL